MSARSWCEAGLAFLLLAVVSVYGDRVMTNSWLVKLNGEHGARVAREVALRNGFQYVSPVSIFSNI